LGTKQLPLTETPKPIATKFCMLGAVQDVITPANFCEDRLGVLAWRGVKFWAFPLTRFVALTTRSHYRARVWWWRQILDRKQNWRYFCACALKNRQITGKMYIDRRVIPPITGNRGRRNEWQGQVFNRKLLNSVSAHAQLNYSYSSFNFNV